MPRTLHALQPHALLRAGRRRGSAIGDVARSASSASRARSARRPCRRRSRAPRARGTNGPRPLEDDAGQRPGPPTSSSTGKHQVEHDDAARQRVVAAAVDGRQQPHRARTPAIAPRAAPGRAEHVAERDVAPPPRVDAAARSARRPAPRRTATRRRREMRPVRRDPSKRKKNAAYQAANSRTTSIATLPSRCRVSRPIRRDYRAGSGERQATSRPGRGGPAAARRRLALDADVAGPHEPPQPALADAAARRRRPSGRRTSCTPACRARRPRGSWCRRPRRPGRRPPRGSARRRACSGTITRSRPSARTATPCDG